MNGVPEEQMTPEQKNQQDFHELVTKTMIHGPCGPLYNRGHLGCCKNSPHGKCTKGFPKEYRSFTETTEDKYADLRRRSPSEGGNISKIYYQNHPYIVDNGWVVPYSPLLLSIFRCHINVECVRTIQTIKYLLGYHFKGEDLASIEGVSEDDEITLYASRRYISAVMAVWRFYEKRTIRMSPSVLQLGVHLQGEQPCRYKPTKEGAKQTLVDNAITPLMDYFNANSCPIRGTVARRLLFEDFPKKFVWDKKDKFWKLRQKGDQIGRVVNIHPRSSETFHLRLLLKHRKGKFSSTNITEIYSDIIQIQGMTSFQSLRTVNGQMYDTYKAACVELDLCEDDKQWHACLTEANEYAFPRQIRHLFCNILVNCFPTDPKKLFHEFKACMSEDFRHKRNKDINIQLQLKEKLIENDLLKSINSYFKNHDFTNASFGISMPDPRLDTKSRDVAEIDPNAKIFFEQNIHKLNKGTDMGSKANKF